MKIESLKISEQFAAPAGNLRDFTTTWRVLLLKAREQALQDEHHRERVLRLRIPERLSAVGRNHPV